MYQKLSKRKKQRKRIHTTHSHLDNTVSILVDHVQSEVEEEIQPIPETIEYSIPHGLGYERSEHKSISQIFRHIQNPVTYEYLSNHEIMQQKLSLQNHVKFLNEQLNQMVRKKMSKIEQGLSRKLNKNSRNNSRFKYNQWDDAGIQMQIVNNRKLIFLLREEYDSLNAKLEKIQKYDHKVKYDGLIKEMKENITKMRMMLFDKKRKNVLNGKKISQLDKRDAHKIYYDVQQDYIALTKKKQQYQKRIQKIIFDNASIVDQQSTLQSREHALKTQAFELLKSLPNETEAEHYKVMYDTKCRKMELSLRKRQREDQEFKRKYYGLLKEYQRVVENGKALDGKLRGIGKEIDGAYESLKSQERKVEGKGQKRGNQGDHRVWKTESSKKEEESQQEEDEEVDGFLLTELNNQKSTTRISKKTSPQNLNQIRLPPFQKARSNSQFHYQMPNKIKRMKTDYTLQQKDKDFSLDQIMKSNENDVDLSRPTERIQKDAEISENISEVKSSVKDFEQEYPEDFQIESPKKK